MITARLADACPDGIAVAVTGPDGTVTQLRYTGVGEVWPEPPPTMDFAAVALAQYAAAAGHDLLIDGPVHADLLTNLDEYLRIWSVWRPDKFSFQQVTATQELPAAPTPPPPSTHDVAGAVMGFSGGVDASFALAAHHDGLMGRLNRRIDHGVLVLGWDIRHGDTVGAERAAASVRRSLGAYGARASVVSTNWQQEFCPAWFMMFNAGLMSVLHTLSATHTAAVHGTERDYAQESRRGPYGSSIAINHLLGHSGFRVISTGGTHRRIDRVAYLANHPALLRELRVCFQTDTSGGNCGRCEKCIRTQLELRAGGVEGAAAFDHVAEPGDLASIRVRNPSILVYFRDVAEHLDPTDPWRDTLLDWVQQERSAARAAGGPDVRVTELEASLAAAERELAEIKASTSWRLTAPLRRARALRR